MRTLCLAFVTAGVIFAQAPVPAASDPASSDALRARAAELFKAASSRPPIQLNSLGLLPNLTPGAPSPYAAAGAAINGRCAVPLTEMKVSPGIDSIARTPSAQAMADPIAVPPPVPSCSEAMPRAWNVAAPPQAVPPAAAPPVPPAVTPPVGPLVKAP